MKKLVALLIVSLMATAAFAVNDDGTDSFGIYFDVANTQNNIPTQGPFAPFSVYLVLMNPAGPTNGFECTVTPVGAPFFALSTTLGGAGALDVDSSANGFAVGTASNYPFANGGLTLVTYSFMLQAMAPLDFYITKASIPSMTGNLPVVTGDGTLRRCGVASGDVTVACARVNGASVVPTEASSFGSVKSLFR
jgi:hypothetical protein